MAITVNSKKKQVTDFYDVNGNKLTVDLQPMEVHWIEENSLQGEKI